MYAVIVSGGKQHKVQPGAVVSLEKIEKGIGESVEFDQVLLVGGDKGIKLGTPLVKAAKVIGEVVEQGRGDKVRIIKFRRRKHYMKRQGHRQYFTKVKITEIQA
jgi:large subunit ribosomal protein L21